MGIDGILNIFKPKGMSSFRVVYEIKKILKVKKIGHTGTLDPNASGILLICLGQATKIARFITDFKKYYQGEMVLGITTDSQDSEGKITGKKDISGSIDREKIKNVFRKYIGVVQQTPPMYSAIYHNGKRLYKLARKGIEVKRKLKKITIYQFSLLDYNPSKNPVIQFEVICSKGTYVRTLCDDIGKDLGCGAYMSGLTRTKVGSYDISESIRLEELEKNIDLAQEKLITIDKILSHFGQITIKHELEDRVLNGASISRGDLLCFPESEKNSSCKMIKVKNDHGKILSIAERTEDTRKNIIFKPVRVFQYNK